MTIGQRRHLVSLEAPGTTAMDADGSYSQTWVALDPPTWYCAIAPATTGAMERIGAGTTLSQATHILSGAHHAAITTQTRVLFNSRQLNVLFVGNRDERNLTTELVCAEVVE
jgi:head-tail adaptor